jgi:hypothetical protein
VSVKVTSTLFYSYWIGLNTLVYTRRKMDPSDETSIVLAAKWARAFIGPELEIPYIPSVWRWDGFVEVMKQLVVYPDKEKSFIEECHGKVWVIVVAISRAYLREFNHVIKANEARYPVVFDCALDTKDVFLIKAGMHVFNQLMEEQDPGRVARLVEIFPNTEKTKDDIVVECSIRVEISGEPTKRSRT